MKMKARTPGVFGAIVTGYGSGAGVTPLAALCLISMSVTSRVAVGVELAHLM